MPNNKRGTRYTKEFKDSILKRLDQPSKETAALLVLRKKAQVIWGTMKTNDQCSRSPNSSGADR
ncbi:MAG TPA: hypothetical protein GX707_21215 [Epulopiscium sp.]|nr:hypothetical protein [Candidatus Epulonipiscium sp.]